MNKLISLLGILMVTLSLSCKKGNTATEQEEAEKAKKNSFYTYSVSFPNQYRFVNYFDGPKAFSNNILFMSGSGPGDNGNAYGLLSAFKSDSTFLFVKKIELESGEIIDMVADGSGGIVVYGNRRPNFYEHYPFVARFNASGELLWSKSFFDTQYTLQNVSQGIFYERALSNIVNNQVALFAGSSTLLLDLNGNLKWRAVTNGYAGYLDDSGITIFSERTGNKAFVIKKLDYSGKLLWAKSASAETNAAMSFSDPLILQNHTILLPYIHKTIATRIPSYGMLNLSKDGTIISNKQYNPAQMNINVETRPYELQRKADGKIWMHVASVKYEGAGDYTPYEGGFYLNEDGTTDVSGFYYGDSQSFPLDGNQVIGFGRDGTSIRTGNAASLCARKNAQNPGVAILNSGLNFGNFTNFNESVIIAPVTVANFSITVSNHKKFDIGKPTFCE